MIIVCVLGGGYIIIIIVECAPSSLECKEG